MLALVTGGAGFIGSHIVERLLQDGYKVRVIDNFSTGKIENLPDVEDLQVEEGDISDFEKVKKIMRGVDYVFHEAAVASVPKTVNDPLGSQLTNYQGTLNLLEAAKINNVKRLVFASSAAVYGDLPGLPKNESMKLAPLTPYAIDKLASEYACCAYSNLYGMETVALRYFNVFGPRQDPSSPYSGVISIFVDRLKQKRQPIIYGDGEQSRDFIYASDVVEANMKAMFTKNVSGNVFNVATGNPATLNILLKTLSRLFDMSFQPEYKSDRTGDIKHSTADVSKAKEMLTWDSKYSLEDGLKMLVSC